jgi:hypothetical protein
VYVILEDVENMSLLLPLKSLANNSELRENITRVRLSEVLLEIFLVVFYFKVGEEFCRRRMR